MNCKCPIVDTTHPDVPDKSNIRLGCICFNDKGYCTSCPGEHHWSEHIKAHVDYEEGEIIEEFDMQAIKIQKQEAVKEVSNAARLINKYIDDLETIINQLE